METKIILEFKNVLKQFGDKYFHKDKFKKTNIINDLDKYDSTLITAIMENELIKKHYSQQIGNYTVVETNKLIESFEMDDFWMDSHSKYSKKIGLNLNKKFLDETAEIVLDFPYKDTMLKAGMSKEDLEKEDLKPNEPFYNEVVAAEEIDIMLDKKIFVNARKYSEEQIENVMSFSKNDNLIIKGNNLLALHTLKEKFSGKTKLIYIDPPYNTGNDSFTYNDQFSDSSWLTFMKNRLEIANELLDKEKGIIFISISDHMFAELKLLADSIFGKENFLNDIIWNSTKSVTNTALISVSHTHTLVYFKNKNYYVKNRTEFRLPDSTEGFSNPDNDPRGPWKADPFQVGGWRPNQQYEIKNPNTGEIFTPNEGGSWKNDYNKFKELLADNRIVFGSSGESGPQRKRFLSEALERGRVAKTIWDDVGTTTNGTRHQKDLFGKNVFSNPKPEELLAKIIELATNEGDLVLDFFMGSATTQAVAMKMNRRFIGIEQMDYIETVSIPRLQKVIEGEQGGISKEVGWQGSGSFVYVELMEKSRGYIDSVQKATSSEELFNIYEVMLENVSLDFRVDLEALEEILKASITLKEKQRLLLQVIDKNQLYYNYSEIDDSSVRDLISDSDYAFNKHFYEGEDING